MGTDIIKQVGVIALLVVILMVGYYSGLNQAMRQDVSQNDTIYLRDTITQYEPILEEKVVLQKVLIPVRDTIWIHDTLYAYLEREQVMWQDSLSRVYASGIMPQIDSVQHYVKERIVTKEVSIHVKKPCKWGIGVHAGYGVQFGEQIRTAPYIGLGISYNFLSW